jgi:5-formyltetrahydrofolate cyclo-ligase
MINLQNEKADLRKEMRRHLKEISPEQRNSWSQQITDRIIDLPEYQHAQTIMAFFSFTTEYDTDPLIRHALSKRKTICIPRVDWTIWRMLPVVITSPEQFTKDDRGLREPTGSEILDPDAIDLVFMPGLAFDLSGHRLGRGGGFYDRFLSQAQLRHALRIAPTFDLQIRPCVPYDELDEPIDIILTPTKLHRLMAHR